MTFTIAGTATSANLDCQVISGESGTGTLNTATATYKNSTIQDTDCAPVLKLTIDKTVTGPGLRGRCVDRQLQGRRRQRRPHRDHL